MPFLRSTRGRRETYSPAKLSALFSLIYQTSRGEKHMDRVRPKITRHVHNAWTRLGHTYGTGDDDEWPAAAIRRAVASELKGQMDLEETWFEMCQKQGIGADNESREEKIADSRLRASEQLRKEVIDRQLAEQTRESPFSFPVAGAPFLRDEKIDPVWGIEFSRNEDFASFATQIERLNLPEDGAADDSYLSMRLGVANKTKNAAAPPSFLSRWCANVQRSSWAQWWRSLDEHTDSHWPGKAWERFFPPRDDQDQHYRSEAEWWAWWEDRIDSFQEQTPNAYLLRNALHRERRRREVLGQPWWSGLLALDSHVSMPSPMNLDEITYRHWGVAYLRDLFRRTYPKLDWDWGVIERRLAPGRDALIDWSAWQDMQESGALHSLHGRAWDARTAPAPGAHEMPQWAWMRGAMGVAVFGAKTSTEERTRAAVDFYDEMSQLHVIPGASLLREGGKLKPRYLEEQAWDVPDDFEGIQEVIHHSAVDTLWTGSLSCTWSRVRAQGTPVRWGRRRSAGVCDFLHTIDRHMRSQGRQESDRPVTAILHAWHLDVESFLRLPEQGGDRVRCALVIPDIFFERLENNGVWTLLDPHIYPEALDHGAGDKGYLRAEEAVRERSEKAPWANKTLRARKLWSQVVEACRRGDVFVIFDGQDAPFSPADVPLVHGRDGVGALPLPTWSQMHNMKATTKETEPEKQRMARRMAARRDRMRGRAIAWPAMAINVAAFFQEAGNTDVNAWSHSVQWALWSADCMYRAAEKHQNLPPASSCVRPLCLGAIGYYEAIQQSIGPKATPEAVDDWVRRIGESWAAMLVSEDQRICSEEGCDVAPLWRQKAIPTHVFSPDTMTGAMRKSRRGGVRVVEPESETIGELFHEVKGYRFSTHSVWAPFQAAARWAGVTPGGLGTLTPLEWAPDMSGGWRLTPTAFLRWEMRHHPNEKDFSMLFQHPQTPSRWPANVVRMCVPDHQEWERRLAHAAMLRPWIDQGVCLTLPTRIKREELSQLLRRAWWSGVSSVRFEDLLPNARPDGELDL